MGNQKVVASVYTRQAQVSLGGGGGKCHAMVRDLTWPTLLLVHLDWALEAWRLALVPLASSRLPWPGLVALGARSRVELRTLWWLYTFVQIHKYIKPRAPQRRAEGTHLCPKMAQALSNSAGPVAEERRTLGTVPAVFHRPRLAWSMGNTTVQNCKRH